MKSYPVLQRGIATAALLAVLALAGVVCTAWQNTPVVMSPQEVLDGLDAKRSTDWPIKLDLPARLVIGRDDAQLTVHTSIAGNLYLIQSGTDGKTLELIFPNALDSHNQVEKGDTRLPRANWRFSVAGPAGAGEITR